MLIHDFNEASSVVNLKLLSFLEKRCLVYYRLTDDIPVTRCATRGGYGAFASPRNFKTFHGNFDICRNFQRI